MSDEAAKLLERLAENFAHLNDADQGMRFSGPNCGETRYDELTGERYFTRSRPAELTVYSDRALFLMDVIQKHSFVIADALRARAALLKDQNNGG